MKFLIAPLLTLVALPLLRIETPDDNPDRVAVEQAMKDYVEGFYQAKPELIERGVSKGMKKMGFWRASPEEEYTGRLDMDFDAAVALASKWNADGSQGEDLKYELEIYEVCDKTACGKLTAKWGIDYFQLAKEEGAWKIHHVMWQSHPPAK